jgi:Na+-transporting NADH:ubiquinone oxidoreductase subunit A
MDIRIKKTWGLALTQMSQRVKNLPVPSRVAFVLDKIPFISPRLLVKTGDDVKIGSLLFEDKKKSYLKFLSPAGGSIASINYGPRRVIHEIVIAVEPEERCVIFNSLDAAGLAKIKQKNLIDHMIAGGVWPYIRELPFRQIADPAKPPPAIWVHLDSTDPFQATSHVYLKNNINFFQMGLAALKRLCDQVHVCQHESSYQKDSEISAYVTHRISGGYPANDPGVVVYHTKKDISENHCWYIAGQDVLMIGRFLMTGIYPTERIVAVSKPKENQGCFIGTRSGAPRNTQDSVSESD